MTRLPRISVVTVSYNQAEFLERAILSVAAQDYPDVEYIVVDPGSTDGSREIIKKHAGRFARIVFEPDRGAADGLNKGFAHATGEIFYYLNSDDVVLPGAFREAGAYLSAHPDVDVVVGHAFVIDAEDRRLRRVWSDPMSLHAAAYGVAIQIQPSTFIRAGAFRRTSGFNVENRSNWDGELVADLALSGARFGTLNAFWSCYRVHKESITGSAKLLDDMRGQHLRRFRKIKGREWRTLDYAIHRLLRARRVVLRPWTAWERLRHGPIFGAAVGDPDIAPPRQMEDAA